MRPLALLAMGLAAAAGCSRTEGRPLDAPVAADAAPRGPGLYPALRCSECHDKMFGEWSGSAHARAASSPIYGAMLRDLGAEGGRCATCHAPLARLVAPSDPVGREGVTCEVCHGIAAVEARDEGGGYTMRTDENRKYGPLCDARDHYFHKMGCSPLHSEATFCAACHLHYAATPSGERLPVFTEFAEWRDGPWARAGVDCQTCHMPGVTAEVAVGSPPRDGVPHHGFLGGGDLRRRALTLTATASDERGKLRVDVALENSGAGHHVPTGMPGRQLVLRVTVRDDRGVEHDLSERVYERALVDEQGRPAPFYRAARVASDNRIPPRQTRRESFALAAPRSGVVRIEALWRAVAPSLVAQLELAPPPPVPMAAAEIAFGARRPGGGRALLPRTTVVKP